MTSLPAERCGWLAVSQLVDDGKTRLSVAKEFGFNESTVRGIYQKREDIKTHMKLSSSEAAYQALRSRNQLLLKTEQLLGRYLDRQAKTNLSVDTREIMDTAKKKKKKKL